MGCNVRVARGGGGVDSALTPGFNLLVPRQNGRSACCSRSRGITCNCCELPVRSKTRLGAARLAIGRRYINQLKVRSCGIAFCAIELNWSQQESLGRYGKAHTALLRNE